MINLDKSPPIAKFLLVLIGNYYRIVIIYEHDVDIFLDYYVKKTV